MIQPPHLPSEAVAKPLAYVAKNQRTTLSGNIRHEAIRRQQAVSVEVAFVLHIYAHRQHSTTISSWKLVEILGQKGKSHQPPS